MVSQPHPARAFLAVFRPFCAVFPPFLCAVRFSGADTERTGKKWRKIGEIWWRNGRETVVALSTGLWDVVSDQEACDFTTRVCSRGGSAVLAAEKVRPTRNLLRRFCVCFDGFRFSYYGGGYRLKVCVLCSCGTRRSSEILATTSRLWCLLPPQVCLHFPRLFCSAQSGNSGRETRWALK